MKIGLRKQIDFFKNPIDIDRKNLSELKFRQFNQQVMLILKIMSNLKKYFYHYVEIKVR